MPTTTATGIDACPTCGAPCRARPAPPVERATPDGAVHARLQGVVARVCHNGHVAVVDDDLVARLAAAIDAQLVTARRRRLHRDEACGACGEPLTLPSRTTETPVVDDSGPSVVTLAPTMAMVRCPGCSIEQVPHRVASTLRAMLPDLVDAVATSTS